MTDIVPKEKAVTHTYTSPRGVVIVVTNVPALAVEFEDGPDEVMYEPAVSKKLNKIIREQLKLNVVPGVYHAHFDKYELGTSVDMAIHLEGIGVSYGEATTKVWKDALDRIYLSWNTIKIAYSKALRVSQIEPPVVRTVRPGSLEFDLQAVKPLPLYFHDISSSVHEFNILQLLIDGYSLAIQGGADNKLLQIPEVAIATLEAVERLSPNDSTFTQVELIPNQQTLHRSKPVLLTNSTYEWAKERRQKLQLSLVDENSRQVMIVGQIWKFDRTGELLIKQIELNKPGVTKYNTTAEFDSTDDDLYERLVELLKYKKRVLFKGIEKRVSNVWSSKPLIKTVEEAPPEDEVAKMAKA